MRSAITLLPLVPALASAFLLPPNLKAVVDKATDLIESGAIPVVQALNYDSFHQTVKLDCKSCAYKVAETAGIQVYTDVPNSLVLDFIGNPTEAFSLKLNEIDLFRVSPAAVAPLAVKQVRNDNGESTDLDVKLGFEYFISKLAPGVRSVRVHITSVDGLRTTRDMDIVELTVIEDPHGILYIAKAMTRAPTPSEASVIECKFNLICRWKAYFADKIKSLRPTMGAGRKGKVCHGAGRLPANHTQDGIPVPPPHGYNGHIDKHRGGPQGHPHHHGTWMYKAVLYSAFFLVAGVFAGFFVSFLGLIVGNLCIFAYRIATGKISCRDCNEPTETEEEGLLSEKRDTAAADDELPAYTDSEGVLRGDEKTEM